ncbi:MAG: MarR family transcriptional regulator [Desulforhopalus sp.]|nr:MarR family transcriptional regulator [Desulforhopalus sp.]
MSSEELAALLHRAGGVLFGQGKHHHDPARGQGRILHTLAREGSLSQRQLQETFAMRSASVSELLLKLERKGLIERERSVEDRRSFLVNLTKEGKAAIDEKVEEQEPFSPLSSEEQEELQRLLVKLLRAWEKEGNAGTQRESGPRGFGPRRGGGGGPGQGGSHGGRGGGRFR